MYKSIALALLGYSYLLTGNTAAAQFETNSWPGEGVPVLIARADALILRLSPRIDSPIITIPYRGGWRVPFDESIHRTIKSRTIVVQRTNTIEISCGASVMYTFMEGEEIEYLQYASEGYGTARVGGRICLVPFEFEVETFGPILEQPETEWWVRVTYGDGTSPGWLLVTDGQISFGKREF